MKPNSEKHVSQVREKIHKCLDRLTKDNLLLAKLLLEVYEGEYFLQWGWATFSQWAKDEYYLTKIAAMVRALGLDDTQTRTLGLVRLRAASILFVENDAEALKRTKAVLQKLSTMTGGNTSYAMAYVNSLAGKSMTISFSISLTRTQITDAEKAFASLQKRHGLKTKGDVLMHLLEQSDAHIL